MDTDWFNQESDKVRITYVPKAPYDFLKIGTCALDGMTLETAQNYDIFLNVALEPLYSNDKIRPREDTEYFHVPIDEDKFWGYAPFLHTKKILDRAFEENKKTYLHCHAGANRSPTIGIFWLFSKTGDLYKACEILSNEPDRQMKRITFYQDLNHIPRELNKFYERYAQFGPDLEKILNTEPKIRTNFKTKY